MPELYIPGDHLQTWFNVNLSMVTNYIHYNKVWDGIAYSSPRLNDEVVEI